LPLLLPLAPPPLCICAANGPGPPFAAVATGARSRDVFGELILGDILMSVDGRPLRDYGDLFAVLDERRVGDRIRLEVLRDGKRLTLAVTLGERAQGTAEE
jgi:S1-C subfamily serine protease